MLSPGRYKQPNRLKGRGRGSYAREELQQRDKRRPHARTPDLFGGGLAAGSKGGVKGLSTAKPGGTQLAPPEGVL